MCLSIEHVVSVYRHCAHLQASQKKTARRHKQHGASPHDTSRTAYCDAEAKTTDVRVCVGPVPDETRDMRQPANTNLYRPYSVASSRR